MAKNLPHAPSARRKAVAICPPQGLNPAPWLQEIWLPVSISPGAVSVLIKPLIDRLHGSADDYEVQRVRLAPVSAEPLGVMDPAELAHEFAASIIGTEW